MQRLRTYNILNKIPKYLFNRVNQLLHVCSVLVNLQPPIIKEKNENVEIHDDESDADEEEESYEWDSREINESYVRYENSETDESEQCDNMNLDEINESFIWDESAEINESEGEVDVSDNDSYNCNASYQFDLR